MLYRTQVDYKFEYLELQKGKFVDMREKKNQKYKMLNTRCRRIEWNIITINHLARIRGKTHHGIFFSKKKN